MNKSKSNKKISVQKQKGGVLTDNEKNVICNAFNAINDHNVKSENNTITVNFTIISDDVRYFYNIVYDENNNEEKVKILIEAKSTDYEKITKFYLNKQNNEIDESYLNELFDLILSLTSSNSNEGLTLLNSIKNFSNNNLINIKTFINETIKNKKEIDTNKIDFLEILSLILIYEKIYLKENPENKNERESNQDYERGLYGLNGGSKKTKKNKISKKTSKKILKKTSKTVSKQIGGSKKTSKKTSKKAPKKTSKKVSKQTGGSKKTSKKALKKTSKKVSKKNF
jgi:hypothetical protein